MARHVSLGLALSHPNAAVLTLQDTGASLTVVSLGPNSCFPRREDSLMGLYSRYAEQNGAVPKPDYIEVGSLLPKSLTYKARVLDPSLAPWKSSRAIGTGTR